MRDAIVVGAGPAGLSAALALLDAGLSVEVIEQHASPPPRVCGSFISPEGTRHLATLGVLTDVLGRGAVPVAEAHLVAPHGRVVSVGVGDAAHVGLALPRPVLERVLSDAVCARGGSLRWQTRAIRLLEAEGCWRVTCRSGRDECDRLAPLAVCADGRFPLLAAGRIREGRPGWFGWNTTFEAVDAAPGSLWLYFSSAGYLGLLTFGDGQTNVCGLTRAGRIGPPRWNEVLSAAIATHPHLARQLRHAVRCAGFRGVGPLPFATRMHPARGGLLAGDAAAVTDPFLGEGISRALGTGPVLAAAFRDAGPRAGQVSARYSQLWRARYEPRLRLGPAGRWLVGRPRVLAAVLAGLGAHAASWNRILGRAHGW